MFGRNNGIVSIFNYHTVASMIRRLILATLLAITLLSPAFSHGGRTGSDGCHFDSRKNKTHCHRKSKRRDSSSFSGDNTYDRKSWKHWIDADRDCQNTRAEILIDYSLVSVTFRRTRCNVAYGKWYDPYTGQTFTQASDIDIDHIVPLAHAHYHGGANWSPYQKQKFANDYQNLLPVEDNANQSKGSKAPHQWMPSNTAYHCTYVQKWTFIKDKYELFYSTAEQNKIDQIESRCNDR